MTRATIRVSGELLASAKRRARETGRSLAGLAADALRNELRRPVSGPRAPEPLPVCRGVGPQQGVVLADAGALEDLMNGLR